MGTKSFKTKNSIVTGSFASDPVDGQNGEVYYNTTTGELRKFTNGAWRNIGDGGLVPVVQNTLANNQSVAANITGLQVTGTKAAKLDYTIRRNHAAVAITGGTPDATFMSNIGIGLYSRGSTNSRCICSLASGKVFVGGNWKVFNKTFNRNYAVFLNSDGTVDTTLTSAMGTGFGPTSDSNNGLYSAAEDLATGKLLVGGWFHTFNGVARNCLIRLNTDGTIDTAFSTALGTAFPNGYNYVTQVVVDSSSNVYCSGNLQNVNGSAIGGICKITSTGAPDTTFNTNIGTGYSGQTNTVAVQSDGKVLVGFSPGTFSGNTRNALVRLNADGTEDTAFYTNLGTAFNNSISKVVLNPAGTKILVVGNFTTFNGNTRNRIVLLNIDGTEDTAFYTNTGTGLSYGPQDAWFAADGTIRTLGGVQVSKISATGVIDGAFATALGSGFGGTSKFAIIPATGDVIVDSTAGIFNGTTYVSSIQKISAAGAFDSTFNTNTGGGPFVLAGVDNYGIGAMPDGKIVVAGNFLYYGNNFLPRTRMIRLNSDGTEDTAFYANLGTGFNNQIFGFAIDSAGRIYAGGQFTTFNGNTRNRIVRLNADGTEDTAFYTNLGTGFNSTVWSITVQPDGKIVVGGDFTTFNGNTRNRIVRLNTDGTEDTAFYTNVNGGANNLVQCLQAQSDNKIILGGAFTTLAGVTRNRFARLNSDGTPDTTFNTNLGTGFNSNVYGCTVMPNGKVMAVGQFTTFNGNTRNRVVQLSSAGVEDSAFVTGSGTGIGGSTAYNVKSDANNNIYISGSLGTYNGVACQGFVKISGAGVIDSTFRTNAAGTMYNGNYIEGLLVTSNAVYGIGQGTNINPSNANGLGIAKLNGDTNIAASNVAKTGQLWLQYNDVSATWEIGGETSVGTDPGVTLSIDATGQVKYTSTNLAGTLVDSFMRWLLTKI